MCFGVDADSPFPLQPFPCNKWVVCEHCHPGSRASSPAIELCGGATVSALSGPLLYVFPGTRGQKGILSSIVPDLNTVVWVWQSLVKQETKQDDKKGTKMGKRSPAATVAPQCDDAETILLKAALLQVICLYQKVVPHVVMQYNFDFSKLLKGITSEQGLREEVPPILQHHMLQVALELPASKLLWLKAQEGPDAEIIGGERSVFYLLMKMFVTSSHLQLKLSTKLLITKVSALLPARVRAVLRPGPLSVHGKGPCDGVRRSPRLSALIIPSPRLCVLSSWGEATAESISSTNS
ncbi:nucleolar pre-ribosomal-associated protein 1-like [Talpa occidentalis]|uniref:nucleolar pre-ribosomal-associated protein 1-like n=1 Tax=Talpa occidentalis TaxID=50954 RepID=UPI00188FFDF2|nr:nucleolar pre-ribosomal-associated protein 1-like [Talpa occidentalis]